MEVTFTLKCRWNKKSEQSCELYAYYRRNQNPSDHMSKNYTVLDLLPNPPRAHLFDSWFKMSR